ncbi:ATP-binding protein [Micromonospora sp. NPDC005806]|uniref:ATP-binding protein n=1 Tax=Micromonospora sp. NPDC005806 TaxID=3364234 RepID=UPI0036A29775
MTATLDRVTNRAARHAGLMRAVVVAGLLRRLDESGAAEEGWLRRYADAGEGECAARLDEFERTMAEPTPLARLERAEALLVVAAGLVDDDIRFGSLFAAFQAPLTARRPTVGLLGWLLAGAGDDPALRCRGLAERGLLEVTNPGDPRAEWIVRLPAPVDELVRTGRVGPGVLPAGLSLHPAAGFPALGDVWVGDLEVETLPAILRDGEVSAVVVRGPARSGRRTLLGAAARELGWDVLACDQAAATPETWRTLAALTAVGPILPVVRCTPTPDETLTLPPLPGVERAVGVTAGPAGGLGGEPLRRPRTLTLPHCDASARRDLWVRAGLRADRDELPAIVESFLLTPGNLRNAAGLALSARRDRIGAEDIREAVGQLDRQQLEPLAVRLEPLAGPRPVLAPAADEELDTLLLRCRHRERLAERGVTADRGLRALFSGPSGTGKTLTARYLAGCLSLDVYRINLAGVVNKYIGVTERNLDRVLSLAEELGVVLLLDEGDSLLARRTDVGDAHDRYANLETNFLLQRLESFAGVLIVTSNAAGRIDPAFQRRIDVTVDFLPPTAEQRWLIWSTHLPDDNTVTDETLTEIARRCPQTGGAIRNAALHASLLALDDDVPVGDPHLLAAVRREYRRIGGTCPLPDRLRRG